MLLMISSHAVSLAGIAADSFFRSSLWLPRGWSAPSFLLLTGVTAAVALDESPQWLSRAGHRAAELVAVVLLSNYLFLAFKYLLYGQVVPLSNPADWVRLLTFQSDSTISTILLPTSLVLTGLRWLVPIQRRFPGPFAAMAGLLYVASAILSSSPASLKGPAARIAGIILTRIGITPVVPMVLLGLVGLAAGRFWSRCRPSQRVTRSAAPVVFAASIIALSSLSSTPMMLTIVGAPLRFVIIVTGAMTLAFHFDSVAAWVSLLGQFGLFVFIVHRAIIHALSWLFALRPLPAAGRYALLVVGTVAAVTALCALRRQSPRLNTALRLARL